MQWSAKTSRGMVRADNEDSWAVEEVSDGLWLAVVADGIGGNEGGELASSLAVEHCVDYVREHRDRLPPGELLERALQHGNLKVFEVALGEKEVHGMGTTLTGALISEPGGRLHVGHVGDSRAYVVGASGIKQITEDHSITGELMRNGAITEEDAMRHPARNVLTMALGTQDSLTVASYREELEPGDVVVLCTDGLTSLVSSRELSSLLATRPREYVASELVNAANARGGYDNVTVVLLWPRVVRG